LFGQSVLLGRRMLDAGARLVQATWLRKQGEKGYAWDSHRENFEAMREDLIPPFDQALNALITDLQQRGQLDETLVVVAGEFGRTPRVTLKTAGREHWSNCFSVMLFGGGIRGGQVYGRSDRIGGYPETDPVSPADLTATIYHCLGVDPRTEILDQNDRPMRLSEGQPVAALI
jgi:arylsulfatase A-like enzyme